MELERKLRKEQLWLEKQGAEMQMSMFITLRSKTTKLSRIKLPASTNCEELDLEHFHAAFACGKLDNRKK